MSEQTLTFANGALWPWIPAAALLAVAGFLWLWAWRRSVRRRIGDEPLVARLVSGVSPTRRTIQRVLWVLAVLLVLAGLLRPQYGLEQSDYSTRGIDLVIALDLSNSMLAADLKTGGQGSAQTARLDGARVELEELLDRLQGGRVALVPFAGIAFPQTPLTSDFEAARLFLRHLHPSDVPIQGTAIFRALDVSLDLLLAERRKPIQGEDGEEKVLPFAGSKYKAILLVTDGEDHEERVMDMAREAAGKGIRIFTVGVGGTEGVTVPRVDAEGQETGERMTDPDSGDLVRTKLNEDLLRSIAQETGGAYFRYEGPSVARDIYGHIESMEKQEYSTQIEERRTERYAFLVLPAMALLLMALLLGERRRRVG